MSNTKGKTVIEWLNEAKEQGYKWADAAIFNAENGLSNSITADLTTPCEKDKEVSSLKEAVDAFWWSKTSEGLDFWDEIHESL